MTTKTSRAALGPGDLAKRLHLAEWQLKRGERDRIIPPRDRSKGWSADLADQLVVHADKLREAIGDLPDMGGWNAAQYLTQVLGVEVTGDAVRELGRQGRLRVVGEYGGNMVFDGRAIAAWDDVDALAVAGRVGRTMMACDAAAHLRIRLVDFAHLVRAGRIKPVRWVEGAYKTDVALYRVGDLDELAVDGSIDWEAVRATKPGGRSPLAKLPTVGREDQ